MVFTDRAGSFEPSCQTCAYGQHGTRSLFFIVTTAYHALLVGLLIGRADTARFARIVAPAAFIVVLLVPTLANVSKGSTELRVGLRCFCLLMGAVQSVLAIRYVLTDPETSSHHLRYVQTRRPVELASLGRDNRYHIFLSQCAAHTASLPQSPRRLLPTLLPHESLHIAVLQHLALWSGSDASDQAPPLLSPPGHSDIPRRR